MRSYRVGVFPMNSRSGSVFTAFTRRYHLNWKGCRVHQIIESDSKEAIRASLSGHREQCTWTSGGQTTEATPSARSPFGEITHAAEILAYRLGDEAARHGCRLVSRGVARSRAA